MKSLGKKSEIARSPGRPRAETRRDRYIPARVSVEEIAQIQDSAKQAGLSVTAWVRKRLGLKDTGYGT